jgi:hypothetical protein
LTTVLDPAHHGSKLPNAIYRLSPGFNERFEIALSRYQGGTNCTGGRSSYRRDHNLVVSCEVAYSGGHWEHRDKLCSPALERELQLGCCHLFGQLEMSR